MYVSKNYSPEYILYVVKKLIDLIPSSSHYLILVNFGSSRTRPHPTSFISSWLRWYLRHSLKI